MARHIAQWPAEQSNPANVRRERQRVLKARVAGWPELVEASQAGYLECLTPFLREARATCWILPASSGKCALVDILGHQEHCPARTFDAIDTGSFQWHGEGACACHCLGGDAPVSRARAAACPPTKCGHADARSGKTGYSVPPTAAAASEHVMAGAMLLGA